MLSSGVLLMLAVLSGLADDSVPRVWAVAWER